MLTDFLETMWNRWMMEVAVGRLKDTGGRWVLLVSSRTQIVEGSCATWNGARVKGMRRSRTTCIISYCRDDGIIETP